MTDTRAKARDVIARQADHYAFDPAYENSHLHDKAMQDREDARRFADSILAALDAAGLVVVDRGSCREAWHFLRDAIRFNGGMAYISGSAEVTRRSVAEIDAVLWWPRVEEVTTL